MAKPQKKNLRYAMYNRVTGEYRGKGGGKNKSLGLVSKLHHLKSSLSGLWFRKPNPDWDLITYELVEIHREPAVDAFASEIEKAK